MNIIKKIGITTQSLASSVISHPYIDGFIHLLFPDECIVCGCELARSERMGCSVCFSELARTYYETSDESTELDKLFWGRVPLVSTYAFLYYQKHNTVKPILQALKYHNRPDVGVFFGKLIGEQIKQEAKFSSIQALIPTPIHWKKRYIRGYNQTEKIVDGIASVWSDITINTKVIKKNEHTGSQTKLNKFGRIDNVESMFVAHPSIKKYQHIAIVDDVITTGATLEAIVRSVLVVAPTMNVSVIGLALAQ